MKRISPLSSKSTLWTVIAICWALALPIQAKDITAVTELFYPYQTLNKDSELSGYSVEIIQALSELTGDNIDIDLLPWSVAYQRALKQPNTMIFSIGKTLARQDLFQWVAALAKEELYFWALPSAQVEPSDKLEDFQRYTIAVVRDATTHQYLRKNGFDRLYPMGGTDSNSGEGHRIQMLLNGRAEIVIANQRSIDSALKSLNYPPNLLTKVFRASPLDSQLYLAFSKGSEPEMVNDYKQAFKTLQDSGKLATIKAKWQIN